MEEDLLDNIHSALPADLLGELRCERDDSKEIPAALFTEARKLLESRGYNSATCDDEVLNELFEAIPIKLNDVISHGSPTAAHYTEMRRLLESPIYYQLRKNTRVTANGKTLADILTFDEDTGAVIETRSEERG